MENNNLNIIHFDLPRKTEQYLTRLQNHPTVKEKESLLMVDGYNYNELKHLEKTFGESLEQITVPGLEPLNPFINQSKRRSSNQGQQAKPKQRSNQKTNRNNNSRNKNNSRNARNKNPRNARSNSNNKNNDNQNNSNQKNNGKQQTRQRKGPFGRTNGGGRANAGRNNGTANNNNRNRKTTVGVSRRGTQAPNNDRAWESDFAEPQERKAESKAVVISYKKRSFSMEKPDSDDS
jgi:superfamily II DNA/RNA helicase